MKPRIMLSVLLVFFLIFTNIVLTDEIREAVKDGNFENVKSLVEKNPTVVIVKDDRSCTPLHFAAETGHKEIAEFLLANGADIKAQNKDQFASLHLAAWNKNKSIIKLFVETANWNIMETL